MTGNKFQKMRKTAAALTALAFGLTTAHVLAQQPGSTLHDATFESGETQSTLIELFTSEGCSSCPSAEKWLSALKSNQDLWKKIVPVAFHVDYWDHFGWRDRFAKPEFNFKTTTLRGGLGRRFGLHSGLCRQREKMARLVRWQCDAAKFY